MTKFFERQSSAIYSKLQLLNPQGMNVVRSKLKKKLIIPLIFHKHHN